MLCGLLRSSHVWTLYAGTKLAVDRETQNDMKTPGFLPTSYPPSNINKHTRTVYPKVNSVRMKKASPATPAPIAIRTKPQSNKRRRPTCST